MGPRCQAEIAKRKSQVFEIQRKRTRHVHNWLWNWWKDLNLKLLKNIFKKRNSVFSDDPTWPRHLWEFSSPKKTSPKAPPKSAMSPSICEAKATVWERGAGVFRVTCEGWMLHQERGPEDQDNLIRISWVNTLIQQHQQHQLCWLCLARWLKNEFPHTQKM